MLVIHGGWVGPHETHPARFVLWCEAAPKKGARRRGPAGSNGRPRAHPFAASQAQLREALVGLGAADGDVAQIESRPILLRLPSVNGTPLPSPEVAVQDATSQEAPALTTWRAPALTLDASEAPALLVSLSEDVGSWSIGDDLMLWIAATRFALSLVCRQRLVPVLQKEGAHDVARWRPVLDDAGDALSLETLARGMPPAARALAWDVAAPEPRPIELLRGYLDAVVDAVAREARPPIRPSRRGSPAEAWLRALVGDPVLEGAPADLAALHAQYRAWTEAAAGPTMADTFRVCFRLVPPPPDPEKEGVVVPPADAPAWTLEYLLQATDDPSLLVPSAAVWHQRGATARFLDRRFDQPHERLLAGLGRAVRLFPTLESSLHSPRPEACPLTTVQAYDFLREKAMLLKASGFGVLVPGLDARIGARIHLGRSRRPPGSTTTAAGLGWDSLVAYNWELALGGEPLSREEFEALARLKQPLVQIRGQWVELRPEQLQQALDLFQRNGRDGEMSLSEALTMALAPNGDLGLPVVEVTAEGWVDDLLHQLRDGAGRHGIDEPPGFVGRLRPYQKVGAAWLAELRRFGLGACLADDMGLGKTIQLIALLLHTREAGALTPALSQGERGISQPTLLICPTSVVGNWRHELARFAPSLRVLVHHGADRARDELASVASGYDLVVSTYALLPRDEAELTSVEWDGVILDEAQNVKNASTNAARTARRLTARWRAALTGTPVENRLSELWSIFQFLNPGYLGSAEEFRARFARPIERARDTAAAARLKTLVAPFILRRLKTDRSIIDDLPEKNEMKVFCTLTREQATLYEAVLKDAMAEIEDAEGIERRGQILATLTKLKQVCDHPALFLHDQSALDDRSGKLARLGEMLEEVTAVGDRALVFTQYAEMGRLLKEHLGARFGREVLFLHGGTPIAERDRMVARFQSQERGPQLFVLSLKAGGTGLNLTRANHVFHFDRWWNPAVENQATDRAFRIGQRRDVQVHKFVCGGTFEEKLDALIERKVELAEAIVGAGEAWITELSTEDLRDLFALRRDAVAVA